MVIVKILRKEDSPTSVVKGWDYRGVTESVTHNTFLLPYTLILQSGSQDRDDTLNESPEPVRDSEV